MRKRWIVSIGLGISGFALWAQTANGALTGDRTRGEQAHRACLGCHGTEVYVPPNRRVTSMKQLQREVERWNGSLNPRLSQQKIADVVAYLNADFYRFPP